MFKSIFIVSLIAGVGCAARVLLSNYFFEKFGPAFPIGTLTVNVIGCLLMGFFVGLISLDGGIVVSPIISSAVTAGFLGGFTTFSSFALQTFDFLKERQWGFATLNIVLSIFLCVVAVGIGHVIALAIIKR